MSNKFSLLNSTAAEYDYIIAGQGCAGLSLAIQLSRSGLPFRNVLIIDKEIKNKNDRTWCFWTKEEKAWYEPAVSRSWNKFKFTAPGFEKEFTLHPYIYKFIRGIDFYTLCIDELKKDTRFHFLNSDILDLKSEANYAVITCSSGSYRSSYIFNSAFRTQFLKPKHINYVQHFLGWLIEADAPCFDADCPTFMDFNTEQENDFRFFYVIPYSANKALVEYTGFSLKPISEEEYERKLREYLAHNFPSVSYRLLEKEKGLIPMAESPFVNPFGDRVINIGTAGGQNKVSTGYAFYFIQKHSAALIAWLKSGAKPSRVPDKKSRFRFYDSVLLQVLHSKKEEGRLVFRRLFEKNKTAALLAFLNEDSGITSELRLFLTVKKSLFLPALLKKIFR